MTLAEAKNTLQAPELEQLSYAQKHGFSQRIYLVHGDNSYFVGVHVDGINIKILESEGDWSFCMDLARKLNLKSDKNYIPPV